MRNVNDSQTTFLSCECRTDSSALHIIRLRRCNIELTVTALLYGNASIRTTEQKLDCEPNSEQPNFNRQIIMSSMICCEFNNVLLFAPKQFRWIIFLRIQNVFGQAHDPNHMTSNFIASRCTFIIRTNRTIFLCVASQYLFSLPILFVRRFGCLLRSK